MDGIRMGTDKKLNGLRPSLKNEVKKKQAKILLLKKNVMYKKT